MVIKIHFILRGVSSILFCIHPSAASGIARSLKYMTTFYSISWYWLHFIDSQKALRTFLTVRCSQNMVTTVSTRESCLTAHHSYQHCHHRNNNGLIIVILPSSEHSNSIFPITNIIVWLKILKCVKPHTSSAPPFANISTCNNPCSNVYFLIHQASVPE